LIEERPVALSNQEIKKARLRLGFPEEVPVNPAGPPRGPKSGFNLSATRADKWENCEYEYKFRNIEKRSDPPTPAMRRGRGVHGTAEVLGRSTLLCERSGPVSKKELLAAFDIEAAKNHLRAGERREAIDILEGVRAHLNFDKTISVEEHFELDLGDNVFCVGVFDRVDYHPRQVSKNGGRDVYECIDYKSGIYVPTLAENISDLQVGLYLVALKTALDATGTDADVKASFWYMPKNRFVEVYWTHDIQEATLSRLREISKEIQYAEANDKYKAAPGSKCVNCSFTAVCPAYAEMVKVGGSPVAKVDEGDEVLLRERKRCKELADVFEEQRKACDEVIKRRLVDRPNLIAGGLKAKLISKTQYDDPDLVSSIQVIADEIQPTRPQWDRGPIEEEIRESIIGLDKKRLNAYLSNLDTEVKKRIEERLDELRTPYDGFSYITVQEVPKVHF
jgi:CRISPR/Cas system-associated exonuclease Cas4 (RecB family)